MSVVAMIFMLTMVVLVISNWDLVKQLQEALEVEQRLSVEAEESARRNARLATSLSDKESKLSYLQMQVINLQADKEEQKKQFAQQKQKLTQLRQNFTSLNQGLKAEQQINLSLSQQLREAQTSFQKSQTALKSLQLAYQQGEQSQQALKTQLASAREQINLVQDDNEKKDQELNSLSQSVESMKSQIGEYHDQQSKHEKAYASLKKKYERLIRPARSAKGKQVVEVTYLKQERAAVIKLRKPRQTNSTEIDKNSLLAYLDKLKAKYPKSIYIKQKFPQSSTILNSSSP